MIDAVLLNLIDLCYAAVDDKTCWQVLTERLAKVLQADAGDIVLEHYDIGVADPLGTTGYDPYFRQTYDGAFLGNNPWIELLKVFPVGQSAGRLYEPNDFERSSYYNDWLKPQGYRHEVGAILERSPDRVIHIGFTRTHAHGPFLHADAVSLDRIIPHVRRAVGLSEKLKGGESHTLGIFHLVDRLHMAALLLDAQGRVLHMNRAADILLHRANCPVSVRANRLRLSNSNSIHELEQALACSASIDILARQSADAGTVLVHRNDHDLPPLVLKAYPLRGGVQGGLAQPSCLLLINDPSMPLPEQKPLLRLAWDLTDAESSLALALANGERISGYAERMGISPATARWHLKNNQTKTGTHRTEDVVRLVHSVLMKF